MTTLRPLTILILIVAAVFAFVHPLHASDSDEYNYISEDDEEGDVGSTPTTTQPTLSPVPHLLWLPTSSRTTQPPSVVYTRPSRASFGEACNRTMRCDPRGWLGCYNGKCSCIKPDEMIYEKHLRKCVSKSGERCAFALDDVEDNSFIMEVTGCVSNAKCSPDGICECGNKFYENANGTCSPALGYLEVCESGAECSGYQALDCKDGVCQCDDSKSVFSPDAKDPQCIGLAGSPCINSKCIEDSTCSQNMCVCTEQFFKDDSGRCAPKVERAHNCTASEQCKQLPGQRFVCLNGQCDCDPKVSTFARVRTSLKYSDRHGYNWEANSRYHEFIGEFKSQCVGLASFPCIDRLCGVNTFCSYPTSRYFGDEEATCKCMNGYTESKSHFCGTGYHTSCSSSKTCIDGLVCKNSYCQCQLSTQTIDESGKYCASQVGGPCNSTSECGKNAECEIQKASGHCACASGYVENMNGLCEAGYGNSCSSLTDCDSIAALQCVDSKCVCDRFTVFNSTLRKCVGLVGAKCNPKEENECIENADCRRGSLRVLPASCMCSPGFEESADYKCKVEGKGDVEAKDALNEL